MIKKTRKMQMKCDCCGHQVEAEFEGDKQIGGDSISHSDAPWSTLALTSDLRVKVELDLCPACAKRTVAVDWKLEVTKALGGCAES